MSSNRPPADIVLTDVDFVTSDLHLNHKNIIAVGHPKNIRQDEDWGRHGNKRLYDWAFETLI